jgi:sulfur-oxidizing protein SoxY
MFPGRRICPRKCTADPPVFWQSAGAAGVEGVRSRLSRRELIRVAGAGAAGSAMWATLPLAIAASSVPEALEELLAGRKGIESARLRLDLPRRFDYGNTVPLAVAVDGPRTAGDHVERVSVLAEGNPFPEVASFHFTPESVASASTRIRLNSGQREVVAVAELSDGSVWLGRRTIEVAVSGCGVEAGVESGDVVRRPEPRLTVPAAVHRSEIVEIKTMISHRMETGLRVDSAGHPIPRRIINRMVCSRDGEAIFAADLSPAIAANAYLNFYVVARESAVLSFTWHEDGGAVYRATRALTVN